MIDKNRIVVYVEGGVVQGVVADDPDAVAVVLVDFDIEGAEADSLDTVPRVGSALDEETAVVAVKHTESMGPQHERWCAIPWVRDVIAGVDR